MSKLGKSHQLWQMNEVNKLIWPSTTGAGLIDEAAWKQTVDLSLSTKNQVGDTVLKKQPAGLAYTNDYIQQAIDQAKSAGIDVKRRDFPAPNRHPDRQRRLASPIPAVIGISAVPQAS